MKTRDRGWRVALAIALGISAVATAQAVDMTRCVTCRIAAVRHLLRSARMLDCRAGIADADATRLQRALERCERHYGCRGAEEDILRAIDESARAIEARVCRASAPSAGDEIYPRFVRGPVGLVWPPPDPATAASFDDVDAYCRDGISGETPLLALPEVDELPAWCSEEEAYTQMVARCGEPRVVVVAAGADAGVATGSAAAPYPSVPAALAACGDDPCHVLVGPGTYPDPIYVHDCAFLEGGVTVADGVVTRGGVHPRIEGLIQRIRPKPFLVARLDVGHLILDTEAESLVSEAIVRGGGASASWDAVGPRICRTRIGASYEGAGVSWQSRRLWIAGSAIAACHTGVGAAWGSHDVRVVDSVVYGRYHAVGTSWGSTGVLVQGSQLASTQDAVYIHLMPDASQENPVLPAKFDVNVTGNRIHSGALPESDPTLNIVVEDNVRE